MSLVAGAPPPPPPPPPPPQPPGCDVLPVELLLEIFEYLTVRQFFKFAVANYPLLRRHGLAPALTPAIYQRIIGQGGRDTDPFANLPVELIDLIVGEVGIEDRLSLILSHPRLCLMYLPYNMSSQDLRRLRAWREAG
ncbi:hypothetical protein CC78DRAFT_343357 [Lojkania enalia]|uniref:F-box domain-containing protein n=1 Tax=Lojkania enalia TaxID=147567 RepID=A0A9P4K3V4_9PLEO|nr:hypothetical protein CC78DRAFT_343357 [Didymosphaeria enalia]